MYFPLRSIFRCILFLVIVGLLAPSLAVSQGPLETPLSQEVLTLLTHEISGQIAFNNLVKLAGAPWIREPEEFTDTFYEAQELYDMVRRYGIETVRLDRSEGEGTFAYPSAGELRILEPEPRLVARLEADAALVASGSQSGEVIGRLAYVPPLPAEEIQKLAADGRYEGTIALAWSHPRGEVFATLEEAGVRAVISFNTRDRYLDPNQVVYSRGSYGDSETLTLGMSVSWRQWSELLEDVERGQEIVVRAQAQIDEHPNKYEAVYAWIPGTEPEAPGVMLTGHLFEGYTKRGANDNAGGPIVQLEILRALHHLIESGQIQRPRRTIYFLWPNEIGGTYDFLARNPDLIDRLSININMDMVTQGLRNSNSVFTMSETPAHLPSYLDGLAKSVLNYVWRTNDIVYLPDSPRGRPGGQYFPRPMMEKNGSADAFRFYIHEATGGSDHICFNNPSVAVPGIEFFTWPDLWYHADTDLPDKADPTEMRRVAFIGAATALVAADLTDERLGRLLDAVSEFGYARVAARGLPAAMRELEAADASGLQAALMSALNIVDAAVKREADAIASVREIYTGSDEAIAAVDDRIAQWKLYHTGLRSQIAGYAHLRAERLGTTLPEVADPTAEEQRLSAVVPDLHPDVKGQQFYVNRTDAYRAYLEANPESIENLEFERGVTNQILNFVNGERSVTEIRKRVAALTGHDVDLAAVAAYLEILQETSWVVLQE